MSNLITSQVYDTDSSDDDDVKKKKKKKIPKLPNRVVVIKNSEKDSGGWMESWSKPKKRSPGHIPHPFRLLALGGVGRGKSNMCKNVFLRHQSSGKKFQKLIIITCSEDSTEWDDCDPDDVLIEIPDLEIFDGAEKTCVILDDFETMKLSKSQLRKLSTLMRFVSSHRNVSCMLSYQSFFDTPPICRKVANCFMIYKPNSHQERDCIANRVGVNGDKMKLLFKEHITGTYDHLFVDKTIGTPYPLRKNIYEVIEKNVSDSDSD
jgi:hypothetical protein